MSMSIAARLHGARDEHGSAVYLVEHQSYCALAKADACAATFHQMLGPDHEQLAWDGAWLLGVHSGKRYKLDS